MLLIQDVKYTPIDTAGPWEPKGTIELLVGAQNLDVASHTYPGASHLDVKILKRVPMAELPAGPRQSPFLPGNVAVHMSWLAVASRYYEKAVPETSKNTRETGHEGWDWFYYRIKDIHLAPGERYLVILYNDDMMAATEFTTPEAEDGGPGQE